MAGSPSDDSPLESTHVLLVEDEGWARQIVRLAFDDAGATANVHVVSDGKTAMEFLHKTGERESAPTPDLILLDLGLPDFHGTEVLQRIRNANEFDDIPIIIFSASTDAKDIHTSYALGADAYLTKPDDYESMVRLVKELEELWLPSAKESTLG